MSYFSSPLNPVRSPYSTYTQSTVRSPLSATHLLYCPPVNVAIISKNTTAIEVTNLLVKYRAGYRLRKMFSKPSKTHWNRTEMAIIWHTNTSKTSRDKVSHFCSIYALYFRLQNTLVNSHTNSYNLRHCVTLIVTLELQRDNTKVKQRSLERL